MVTPPPHPTIQPQPAAFLVRSSGWLQPLFARLCPSIGACFASHLECRGFHRPAGRGSRTGSAEDRERSLVREVGWRASVGALGGPASLGRSHLALVTVFPHVLLVTLTAFAFSTSLGTGRACLEESLAQNPCLSSESPFFPGGSSNHPPKFPI